MQHPWVCSWATGKKKMLWDVSCTGGEESLSCDSYRILGLCWVIPTEVLSTAFAMEDWWKQARDTSKKNQSKKGPSQPFVSNFWFASKALQVSQNEATLHWNKHGCGELISDPNRYSLLHLPWKIKRGMTVQISPWLARNYSTQKFL